MKKRTGYEQLISRKEYDRAVALLDEGIEPAEKRHELGFVYDRMEKKIGIYRQTDNIPALVVTAKELFIREGGDLKYYHLLKEICSGRFLENVSGNFDSRALCWKYWKGFEEELVFILIYCIVDNLNNAKFV